MSKSNSNANHFYNQQFDQEKFGPSKKRKSGGTSFADGSDALANIKKQYVSFLHVPSDSSVFFKAFITSFNETYTSTWKSEQVFGRADQIHSFVQTGRNINLSLMVPAASESEAFENLGKVQKLVQFLYPNYEHLQEAQTISQGPLIRLKVMNMLQDMSDAGIPGNANSETSKAQFFSQYSSRGIEPSLGQLGLITSLTVNHNIGQRDAGVFEKINQTSPGDIVAGTAPGTKSVPNTILPKNIEIVISFTAIHEHPLGWDSQNRFSANRDVATRKSGELFPYGVATSSPAKDTEARDTSQFAAESLENQNKINESQRQSAEARYGDGFFGGGDRRAQRELERYKAGKIKNPRKEEYIKGALQGHGYTDEEMKQDT